MVLIEMRWRLLEWLGSGITRSVVRRPGVLGFYLAFFS